MKIRTNEDFDSYMVTECCNTSEIILDGKKLEIEEEIRTDIIDKMKSNCIQHIQKQRPLTLDEIIYIIQFEAEQLKH